MTSTAIRRAGKFGFQIGLSVVYDCRRLRMGILPALAETAACHG
jgi:hypothetical protein